MTVFFNVIGAVLGLLVGIVLFVVGGLAVVAAAALVLQKGEEADERDKLEATKEARRRALGEVRPLPKLPPIEAEEKNP